MGGARIGDSMMAGEDGEYLEKFGKKDKERLRIVNTVLEKVLVFKKHDMMRDSDPLGLRVIAKVSFLVICIVEECTSR